MNTPDLAKTLARLHTERALYAKYLAKQKDLLRKREQLNMALGMVTFCLRVMLEREQAAMAKLAKLQ